MKKTIWMLLAAAALGATGCIHHETTVYHDVERAPVEFENDAAARIFYETLSKRPASRKSSESKTEVEIPLVFGHKRREVQGENFRFNRAVEICDTNRDGTITEQEARIYASHHPDV